MYPISKSIIDYFVSILAIILLLPIFLIVTIALIYYNNGKPFFFQTRPGKNGKPFRVIKFKTMNEKKDKDGNLLPPSKRITPIGSFIRATSLDEIPQLINVIKGDMSLVGPRPLRLEYLPLYSDVQSRRHEVKPGITGWAQINGRNTLDWDKRFELDVWYVDNRSFLLDIKILVKTISKVFKREGINSSVEITSEPFKGVKLHE